MFLKNAIEKILNNPAIKKHIQLKKACESTLGFLFLYFLKNNLIKFRANKCRN